MIYYLYLYKNINKMKVIAIGDPHFKVDNIEEINIFIEKILQMLKTEKPDFIVLLGDVLHTHERLHTIPLNKAYEFVNSLREISETFVLVGNHDYIQNQQFLTTNHWMNGMKEWKNVHIIDKPLLIKKQEFTFVFCPYVPVGRFNEALEFLKPLNIWKEADCIFAHQEFFGCKMGAIQSVEGDKWCDTYPQVVSGHIHSKQNIGDNIYYCGSSMQHAFGESETNIIPILTWDTVKTKYKLNEIDLGLSRKKIIYTDIENIEKVQLTENGDKIKISLSGCYDEFKAFKKTNKYKDIIEKGAKIVFKQKKDEKDEKEKYRKEIPTIDESDFLKILSLLVKREKNSSLYQLYESVVNDKIVNEKDILFL